MLQNSRATALTVFELLRENQLGGGVGGKITPAPPQLTPRLALINLQCGCNAHMMTNDHKLCLTHSCYP